MKNFSDDEIKDASTKIPKEVRYFNGSPTYQKIVEGIRIKHGLNFRHIIALSYLLNVTLVGLEDESAFETNLHQLLPELSNATTHELVQDINDRIFKEARRRVELGIVEPSPWIVERNLTAEEIAAEREYNRINNLDDDDPEVLRLREEEELRRRTEEQEEARRLKDLKEKTVLASAEESEPIDDDEVAKFDQLLDQLDSNPETELPPRISDVGDDTQREGEPTSALKVTASRLEAPQITTMNADKVGIPVAPPLTEQKLGQSTFSGVVRGVVTTPISGASIQEVQKISPPPPRLKGDSDPYREAVD